METKRQYFSLVSDRIMALKEKLEEVQEQLSKVSKEEKKEISLLQLEIKFLKYKIEYLEKIKDLPFYIVISELSSDQLREIRKSIGKLGLSLEETRVYLMEKFNLHDIPSLIKHSDISYLSQIDNYDIIMNLMAIQKRNGNYVQQKRDLQRELEIPEDLCVPSSYQVFGQPGKTKPLCYHEIDYIKERTSAYEAKLEQVRDTLAKNYTGNTFEEINFYRANLDKNRLSKSFIEKHKEKVLSCFPEQKTSIKYLLQSETNKNILRNASMKKRKKKEQDFLECVLAWYKKDDTFAFFGLDNTNLFMLTKDAFLQIIASIEQKIQGKKEKIAELIQSIHIKENQILNTARDYNMLQNDAKARFSKIIYSEIPSFQSSWLHWLWQVPNLLEVFIKGHTLAEVETLVDCLKDPFPYYKEEELIKPILYRLIGNSSSLSTPLKSLLADF